MPLIPTDLLAPLASHLHQLLGASKALEVETALARGASHVNLTPLDAQPLMRALGHGALPPETAAWAARPAWNTEATEAAVAADNLSPLTSRELRQGRSGRSLTQLDIFRRKLSLETQALSEHGTTLDAVRQQHLAASLGDSSLPTDPAALTASGDPRIQRPTHRMRRAVGRDDLAYMHQQQDAYADLVRDALRRGDTQEAERAARLYNDHFSSRHINDMLHGPASVNAAASASPDAAPAAAYLPDVSGERFDPTGTTGQSLGRTPRPRASDDYVGSNTNPFSAHSPSPLPAQETEAATLARLRSEAAAGGAGAARAQALLDRHDFMASARRAGAQGDAIAARQGRPPLFDAPSITTGGTTHTIREGQKANSAAISPGSWRRFVSKGKPDALHKAVSEAERTPGSRIKASEVFRTDLIHLDDMANTRHRIDPTTLPQHLNFDVRTDTALPLGVVADLQAHGGLLPGQLSGPTAAHPTTRAIWRAMNAVPGMTYERKIQHLMAIGFHSVSTTKNGRWVTWTTPKTAEAAFRLPRPGASTQGKAPQWVLDERKALGYPTDALHAPFEAGRDAEQIKTDPVLLAAATADPTVMHRALQGRLGKAEYLALMKKYS